MVLRLSARKLIQNASGVLRQTHSVRATVGEEMTGANRE